jgi:hypothetical protein
LFTLSRFRLSISFRSLIYQSSKPKRSISNWSFTTPIAAAGRRELCNHRSIDLHSFFFLLPLPSAPFFSPVSMSVGTRERDFRSHHESKQKTRSEGRRRRPGRERHSNVSCSFIHLVNTQAWIETVQHSAWTGRTCVTFNGKSGAGFLKHTSNEECAMWINDDRIIRAGGGGSSSET